MNTLNVLLGGLIVITIVAVVLKDQGTAASNVLSSFGAFNERTFGTFLRG